MPKFDLTAVETYEYFTYYSDIEAESLDDAVQQVIDGDVDMDSRGDSEYGCFLGVVRAVQDDEELEVPHHFAAMINAQDLAQRLRELLEWEAGMGHFEAKCWTEARKTLELFDHAEPAAS